MTGKIISHLSKQSTIVTSLEEGINLKVIKETLKNDLNPPIVVLNSGIDYEEREPELEEIKKEVIDKGGLILSEYPLDHLKLDKNERWYTNRLVAGLSNCTLLIEAYFKNIDSYNTACLASMFGKNVACVPSNPLSESETNKLLKQGAYLVESASDLKDLYNDNGKRYEESLNKKPLDNSEKNEMGE